MKRAAICLLAFALGLGLAACGGGGGSSTSAASAPGQAPAPHPKRLSGHPEITFEGAHRSSGPRGARAKGLAAQPQARRSARAPLGSSSARRAEARRAIRHRALAKQAGRAAPFLVPVGDNSIPTYGQESTDAQREAAEASLGSYLGAREAGEWKSACAGMAAIVQKQLAQLAGEGGEGCAGAYARFAERIPASARANPLTGSLAAFRVKEDKAFALFYGPSRQQYMMPMTLEGDDWKVGQIEPIPWPVGAAPATHP